MFSLEMLSKNRNFKTEISNTDYVQFRIKYMAGVVPSWSTT